MCFFFRQAPCRTVYLSVLPTLLEVTLQHALQSNAVASLVMIVSKKALKIKAFFDFIVCTHSHTHFSSMWNDCQHSIQLGLFGLLDHSCAAVNSGNFHHWFSGVQLLESFPHDLLGFVCASCVAFKGSGYFCVTDPLGNFL